MELEESKEKANTLQKQMPTATPKNLFGLCGGFLLETQEDRMGLWTYILKLNKK